MNEKQKDEELFSAEEIQEMRADFIFEQCEVLTHELEQKTNSELFGEKYWNEVREGRISEWKEYNEKGCSGRDPTEHSIWAIQKMEHDEWLEKLKKL